MQIKTIAKFVTVITTSVASQSVVSTALENVVGSVPTPGRLKAVETKIGIHAVSAAVGGTIGGYVAKEFDETWDETARMLNDFKTAYRAQNI